MSISYPKSVYPAEVITAAARDYRNICFVTVEDEGDALRCTFSRSVADLGRTALEFSNYLIELANTGGADGSC